MIDIKNQSFYLSSRDVHSNWALWFSTVTLNKSMNAAMAIQDHPDRHDLEKVDTCYYCRGQDFIPKYQNVVDRLQISNNRWHFMQCNGCQAVILSPRPKSEHLKDFYPKHYTFSLNKTQSSFIRKCLSNIEYWLHFRWIYRSQANIALKLANKEPKHNIKVLDIGCGNGLLLKEFHRLGCDVEGADMREDVVDYVKNVLGFSAKQLNVNTLSSAYPHHSFDIIILVHLLEHVTNPAELVEQCIDILKPGGSIVMAVPLADSMQIGLFKARATSVTEAPRHVSIPSQRSIMMLGQRLGIANMNWTPEGMVHCMSGYGLSLIPEGALTHQHKSGTFTAIFKRFLVAIISYFSIPLVLIENYILCKPIAGMFAFTKIEQ